MRCAALGLAALLAACGSADPDPSTPVEIKTPSGWVASLTRTDWICTDIVNDHKVTYYCAPPVTPEKRD